MDFAAQHKERSRDIVAMFHQTFTASEGLEAGRLIKALVTDMLGSLGPEDMQVFSALEGDTIHGSIIFTRLTYNADDRTVFILSPVAISTSQQGKGLGQRLINHGLDTLRKGGVDVILTYGDINFYSKVGFSQITEAEAQPPLPLGYPHGWLGQTLTGTRFTPLAGPSSCVAPLNDPTHW